jgi:hypothetical protein
VSPDVNRPTLEGVVRQEVRACLKQDAERLRTQFELNLHDWSV